MNRYLQYSHVRKCLLKTNRTSCFIDCLSILSAETPMNSELFDSRFVQSVCQGVSQHILPRVVGHVDYLFHKFSCVVVPDVDVPVSAVIFRCLMRLSAACFSLYRAVDWISMSSILISVR